MRRPRFPLRFRIGAARSAGPAWFYRSPPVLRAVVPAVCRLLVKRRYPIKGSDPLIAAVMICVPIQRALGSSTMGFPIAPASTHSM